MSALSQMGDLVPTQLWLLIAIAAVAFAPMLYVFKHIAHASERRGPALSPHNSGWRSSGQLVRCLAILALTAGLAVFIFTPIAVDSAQSEFFWPAICLGLGAFAWCSVVKGFRKGEIEPLIQHFSDTYERATQPKRFWASLLWNALLGSGFVWLAVFAVSGWNEDRCFGPEAAETLQTKLSACSKLIADVDSPEKRADILAERGIAYHWLNDYPKALADYSQAIRLDPQDSYSLYNRGLVYAQLGDPQRALADYDKSLELRPENADGYLHRGLIFLNTGQLDKAIADFTRAHEADPADPWPLANRGVAHAWKADRALALKDFERVRKIDFWNPALLHGQAILDLQDGNLQSAITHLSAALHDNPDDTWALRMRADTYWKLGERDKARDDDDRLSAINDR